MPTVAIILLGIAIVIALIIINSIKIVPQKSAFLVERLGKYNGTLKAGFHFIIPFVDKVAYRHTLKDQAIYFDSQSCITRVNISV
jgi:regulator of protease activity HflC (stomatin/prohibitin superfamily)